MEVVAILDFETTGLSPDHGERATEIGIVLLRNGEIVDQFQSLMNAGVRIPSYVAQLTGITTQMVSRAPPAVQVMREAARFVGRHPIVAHNAAFDRKFWQAELSRAGLEAMQTFACTMLISRRVYPDAPGHGLGVLAQMLDLPPAGRAHRAMADALTASHLWVRMQRDLSASYNLPAVSFDLMSKIQTVGRHRMPAIMAKLTGS